MRSGSQGVLSAKAAIRAPHDLESKKPKGSLCPSEQITRNKKAVSMTAVRTRRSIGGCGAEASTCARTT